MKGYGGRLLFVDLTTGASRIESLAEDTARALLGGNGLAARLLYDQVPAGIDAFDAPNAVVYNKLIAQKDAPADVVEKARKGLKDIGR